MIVALLHALLLLEGPARGETKDVPYTKTPVQLSGALGQFPAAAKLFVLSPSTNGPSDNTSTFYAAWDDQYLYFGVEVADAALYCTAEPRDSSTMWSNDGVELNFDTKNKKALAPGDPDFRQWILPINWQSNPYDAHGSGATGDAASFTSNVEVAVTLQGTLNDANPDTGYALILRIPWSDLGLTPADGLSFGFDGAVNDIDQSGGTFTYQDWATLNPFAQPDRWGSLALTGKGGGPQRDSGAADAWVPVSDGTTSSDAKGRRPSSSSCDCAVGTDATTSPAALLGLALLLAWRRLR
jgi:MYXO-CTERM domain-containing protein